jgi:hypothetical protein
LRIRASFFRDIIASRGWLVNTHKGEKAATGERYSPNRRRSLDYSNCTLPLNAQVFRSPFDGLGNNFRGPSEKALLADMADCLRPMGWHFTGLDPNAGLPYARTTANVSTPKGFHKPAQGWYSNPGRKTPFGVPP